MTTANRFAAEAVLETLTRVIEPGYGINLVDLGLVYGIETSGNGVVVTMTLPTEDYDTRDALVAAIVQTVRRRHNEAQSVRVDVVWDPPWRDDFITPDGELQLLAPITVVPGHEAAPISKAVIEESLKLVIDPELGLNIVDLGLIYELSVDGDTINVVMTLTTPGCPLQATIEAAIHRVLETRHPSLMRITIDLVWDPPWDSDRISDVGRSQLATR